MTASAFTFEPAFLAAAAAAAVAYRQRAVRDPPGPARTAAFALGLLLVALPLNSPLETIAREYLLLAHLVQNALIADFGPPLIILGLTPGTRSAIAAAFGRPFRWLTMPPVAVAVWLLAWYLVHLPLIYDGVLRHPGWLNGEHAVLVVAGLLFWWPVIADQPQQLSTLARIGYLLVGVFLVAPLGFLFIFTRHAIYGYYVSRPRLWQLSPLRDQQLGGIFMNVEQSVVFFAAVAVLFVRLLDEEERAADPG